MFVHRSRVVRSIACVFLLLVPADRVDAQQSEDFGIWLGGFANGKLPPSLNNDQGSWRLWLDLQVRFGDDASSFAQGIVRPGIGYLLGRGWTVWGGYGYIRTDPPYSTSTTTEQRIWEQASWSGIVGATALSSRTRIEQRFVRYRKRDRLAIAGIRQGRATRGFADDVVSGGVRQLLREPELDRLWRNRGIGPESFLRWSERLAGQGGIR